MAYSKDFFTNLSRESLAHWLRMVLGYFVVGELMKHEGTQPLDPPSPQAKASILPTHEP